MSDTHTSALSLAETKELGFFGQLPRADISWAPLPDPALVPLTGSLDQIAVELAIQTAEPEPPAELPEALKRIDIHPGTLSILGVLHTSGGQFGRKGLDLFSQIKRIVKARNASDIEQDYRKTIMPGGLATVDSNTSPSISWLTPLGSQLLYGFVFERAKLIIECATRRTDEIDTALAGFDTNSLPLAQLPLSVSEEALARRLSISALINEQTASRRHDRGLDTYDFMTSPWVTDEQIVGRLRAEVSRMINANNGNVPPNFVFPDPPSDDAPLTETIHYYQQLQLKLKSFYRDNY